MQVDMARMVGQILTLWQWSGTCALREGQGFSIKAAVAARGKAMMEPENTPESAPIQPSLAPATPVTIPVPPAPEEIGGPQGLEPTRYGDWERRGRCIDF